MWMTGKGVPEEGAPEERQARVPPQCEAKGLGAGGWLLQGPPVAGIPRTASPHMAVALAWHWPGQKCVPQWLPCSLPF